jgi:Ca-activated chloride channel family protein
MFLGAMQPDLMPIQGTDLGAALRVSLDALEESARDAKVLVLVTDAEDHEATYDAELARVQELGVQLYVVVVGTGEGVPIPVYDDEGARQGFLRDEDGNVVTTRVGEQALEDLARRADASVVRVVSGGTALDELVDEIARGEGEELDALQVTRFEEQFQLFLGLALFLLVVDAVVSDRRRTEHRWAGRFE